MKDLNVFKGIVVYPRTFINIFLNKKKMLARKGPVTQTATVKNKNRNNAFCIYFRLDERPSWSIVKNAINTKNYGICNTLSLYKKQLPIWGCSKIISLTRRGRGGSATGARPASGGGNPRVLGL